MPLELELALRLFAAAALAALIGIEREIADQPAGFRTHILVALGACLFALVSAYAFDDFRGEPGVAIRLDPTRIAAQIVTGIGFLGAGAILRSGMSVRGLTTAASLWVVAAIGTAVGLGEYVLGAVTAAITLLTLLLLRPIRGWLVRGLKREREEFLIQGDAGMELGRLISDATAAGLRIEELRIEEEAPGQRHVLMRATLPPDHHPEQAAAALGGAPGVKNVDWTR